jgi:hypothetical protein
MLKLTPGTKLLSCIRTLPVPFPSQVCFELVEQAEPQVASDHWHGHTGTGSWTSASRRNHRATTGTRRLALAAGGIWLIPTCRSLSPEAGLVLIILPLVVAALCRRKPNPGSEIWRPLFTIFKLLQRAALCSHLQPSNGCCRCGMRVSQSHLSGTGQDVSLESECILCRTGKMNGYK